MTYVLKKGVETGMHRNFVLTHGEIKKTSRSQNTLISRRDRSQKLSVLDRFII